MDRYTSVARALHWILAVLIIVNLVLGIGHDALPKDWAVMPVSELTTTGFILETSVLLLRKVVYSIWSELRF